MRWLPLLVVAGLCGLYDIREPHPKRVCKALGGIQGESTPSTLDQTQARSVQPSGDSGTFERQSEPTALRGQDCRDALWEAVVRHRADVR